LLLVPESLDGSAIDVATGTMAIGPRIRALISPVFHVVLLVCTAFEGCIMQHCMCREGLCLHIPGHVQRSRLKEAKECSRAACSEASKSMARRYDG
jgi:hypothetical protein